MVAPGKITEPGETGGQADVSYRYFEGAGAGAVLLGQVPRTELYWELFDWPEAVVEISSDGADTADTVSSLLGDPERLSSISRRNATEALRRHDWVHRWHRTLEIAGLPPTPGILDREARLNALADTGVPLSTASRLR